MAEKLTRAQRKLRKLLMRFTQRQLAEKLGVKQPTICQLNTGEHTLPLQKTRLKFERVGIDVGDWER